MTLLRRVRGLLGFAVIGALSWVPIGLAVDALIMAIGRGPGLPFSAIPRLIPPFAAFGAVCGLVCGGLLLLMERRRSFSGLTLKRIAAWGTLGGIAIPLAFSQVQLPSLLLTFAIYGMTGAIMSAGTLAIARRAPLLASGTVARQIRDVSP